MKLAINLTFLYLVLAAVCLGDFVAITSTEGVKLKARILNKMEQEVTFETVEGKIHTVPISRLSEESKLYIEKWNPLEFSYTFENSWGEDIKQNAPSSRKSPFDEYKLKISCSSGVNLKFSKKELAVFPEFFANIREKIQILKKEDVPSGFSFLIAMPGESEGLKWKASLHDEGWRFYMPKYFNQTKGMSIFEVFEPSSKYISEKTYLYWKDYLESFEFENELQRYAELRKKVN